MSDSVTHPLAVERGNLLVFSDVEDDGPMWTSTGPRLIRARVHFKRSFRAAPEVLLSLEMWDFDAGANMRGDLSPDAITADGFDVVFKTWGDTRIARIRAGWIAIGSVSHADDWSV